MRVVRGYDAGIEAALTDKVTAERDEELRVFLSEMRLVKDDFEIGELQKAVDSTVRGFEDVVKVLDKAEATSERYIEGTFFLRARVEGNDVGYGSICAAGPHACTLHWVRNDGPVRSGELLLLDAGVETHTYYTADVTRTLPIDGTYNALQKKIYDAVYDAQEAGIAAVKPGAKYRDFHDAAQRVLAERLVEWGLVEGPVERVLELGLQRRWTLHGTGHMLGMDVHDCAVARTETYVDGTLEPGMVLTVEPGLYFQTDDLTVPEEYRGIGVRIEDDLLHRGRQPEPVRRAAPPVRRGRGVDGRPEGLTRRTRAGYARVPGPRYTATSGASSRHLRILSKLTTAPPRPGLLPMWTWSASSRMSHRPRPCSASDGTTRAGGRERFPAVPGKPGPASATSMRHFSPSR
ncbi:xaa-Pro aminopeptidase I [Streptomyces griseoflavus Tu4000]|uniref:Xaa-Pro aminopeptidase n=1 Tax=Streptomyces griseoflavus Tu4000 TaxID=467200 RepID=D9XQ01_9ACTN|nr:xaa-Pro aminopeptidase I [Streptomyces griseoflavus Tu4000]